VRTDAFDVQHISSRFGCIWDRVGVGVIMMDRRCSNGLSTRTNQDWDIHVRNNVNWDIDRDRSGDWHVDRNLNGVLNSDWNRNRHRNGDLDLDRTLNLLSNNNVVRASTGTGIARGTRTFEYTGTA